MNENKNEEAVSPVIGVILMVAITVILAAIVFVLVSNLGKHSGVATPNIAFTTSDGAVFTVVRADPGLAWADFSTTSAGCTLPSGTVDAADQVTGCTSGFRLVHAGSNSLVYEYP